MNSLLAKSQKSKLKQLDLVLGGDMNGVKEKSKEVLNPQKHADMLHLSMAPIRVDMSISVRETHLPASCG